MSAISAMAVLSLITIVALLNYAPLPHSPSGYLYSLPYPFPLLAMTLLSDFEEDMKKAAKEHAKKSWHEPEICEHCETAIGIHTCGDCGSDFESPTEEQYEAHLCLSCYENHIYSLKH